MGNGERLWPEDGLLPGTCFACGQGVSPDNLCFGCGAFICGECDMTLGLTGRHSRQEHLTPEDADGQV